MRIFTTFRIVCVVSGFLLLPGCGPRKADPKAVEQRLASAIPLQSTASQVLDYLNRAKTDHSDYLRGAQGNSIEAIIRARDNSRWRLAKTDYSVVFRFDGHDRLVGYEVRPVYTGP